MVHIVYSCLESQKKVLMTNFLMEIAESAGSPRQSPPHWTSGVAVPWGFSFLKAHLHRKTLLCCRDSLFLQDICPHSCFVLSPNTLERDCFSYRISVALCTMVLCTLTFITGLQDFKACCCPSQMSHRPLSFPLPKYTALNKKHISLPLLFN